MPDGYHQGPMGNTNECEGTYSQPTTADHCQFQLFHEGSCTSDKVWLKPFKISSLETTYTHWQSSLFANSRNFKMFLMQVVLEGYMYKMLFYHMMSWKWKMDQSYVSIQVTYQVVVDWQRPAKSNYDLLLSSTSKFNWMHYSNDVKLFQIYQMIYNCDEDEKYTWKYIQTVSNSLLWFHTMGLPTMVAHFILYWWHCSQCKQLQSWFCK